jgi:hypothetical protein
MKRHLNHAGLCPAVDLKWLSRLVTLPRITLLFLDRVCSLHLADPGQWTIWTACSSHWKVLTRIATALYKMHSALFRQLKYYLRLTYSVKSVNLLKHKAIRCCSSTFGIAPHSGKASSNLNAGHGYFIIPLDRCCGWGHILVVTTFPSICIQLSILKNLPLGFCSQNLQASLITIQLWVRLFRIPDRFFWEFRAYI